MTASYFCSSTCYRSVGWLVVSPLSLANPSYTPPCSGNLVCHLRYTVCNHTKISQ